MLYLGLFFFFAPLAWTMLSVSFLFLFACTSALAQVINKPADGGVTALHMAALNGHVESVQLLLDLGASVSAVTVEDGTTIDLIGNLLHLVYLLTNYSL